MSIRLGEEMRFDLVEEVRPVVRVDGPGQIVLGSERQGEDLLEAVKAALGDGWAWEEDPDHPDRVVFWARRKG